MTSIVQEQAAILLTKPKSASRLDSYRAGQIKLPKQLRD